MMISSAVVSAVFVTSVMYRKASRWICLSFLLVVFCSSLDHHITAVYVIVGRIIAVYIHHVILGVIPHVLLTDLLSCCKDTNTLSHLVATCNFQLSFGSISTTPNYLTWEFNYSSFP